MKIKEFYSDESKWCQYDQYRNIDGEPVSYEDKVYAACLLGAINICYPNEIKEIYVKIKEKVGLEPGTPLSQWNDSVTFGEVKKLVEELDI